MTHSPQHLMHLAARWYGFTQMLIAFARQMTKLEYAGATAALDRALMIDVMAQLVLHQVICEHAKIRTLPKSPERDALLARLEVTAHVLTMLRAVALNVKRGPAARAAMIGAMALDFEVANDAPKTTRVEDIAAIDSS